MVAAGSGVSTTGASVGNGTGVAKDSTVAVRAPVEIVGLRIGVLVAIGAIVHVGATTGGVVASGVDEGTGVGTGGSDRKQACSSAPKPISISAMTRSVPANRSAGVQRPSLPMNDPVDSVKQDR
jgi:hypothetical protein